MFDYLDNAVIKLCDMSTVGTDLGTVKQQIEELKVCKTFILQHCFTLNVWIKYFIKTNQILLSSPSVMSFVLPLPCLP